MYLGLCALRPHKPEHPKFQHYLLNLAVPHRPPCLPVDRPHRLFDPRLSADRLPEPIPDWSYPLKPLHAKSRRLAVVLADLETRLSDQAFLPAPVGLLAFLGDDDLVAPYTQKLLLVMAVVVRGITLLFQVVDTVLLDVARVAMRSKLRGVRGVNRIVELLLLQMGVCIIIKRVVRGFIVETLRMGDLPRLGFTRSGV